MVHFRFIRCEFCRYPLDFWFFSVSTFLGPETVVCKKCRENIFTGRTELAQKNLKQKAIFILMCALYLSLGGYAFGLSFFRMDEIWEKLPEVKDPTLEQLKYHILSGVILVAIILGIKIMSSLSRWNEIGDAPSEENLWSMSFTFGTQMKMILFLFFLYLVAGAYT